MASRNGHKKSHPTADEPLADTAVVRKRREEIVSAATEIIASEGIHRLSLARIENRVHMSRGQLTYYFRSKEKILLAVFDRMLAEMMARHMEEAERGGFNLHESGSVLDKLKFGLNKHFSDSGSERTQLMSLVHTFQAQVQHRPDFRAKLAEADVNMRNHIAADVEDSAVKPAAPSQVIASIIMAMFEGLGNQLAVNPQAFDRGEMLRAIVRMLAQLLANPATEFDRD